MFLGWSGDTTAATDTLHAGHAASLRPHCQSSIAVQEVQLSGAADALFGTASWPSEEAHPATAAGNRTGGDDLGDFLAARQISFSSIWCCGDRGEHQTMKKDAMLSRIWLVALAGLLGIPNGCFGQPSAPVAAASSSLPLHTIQ